MSSTPPLLTARMVIQWMGLCGYFFYLFWYYLPFAIAAKELADLVKRYS
jgi:hypothetical protein